MVEVDDLGDEVYIDPSKAMKGNWFSRAPKAPRGIYEHTPRLRDTLTDGMLGFAAGALEIATLPLRIPTLARQILTHNPFHELKRLPQFGTRGYNVPGALLGGTLGAAAATLGVAYTVIQFIEGDSFPLEVAAVLNIPSAAYESIRFYPTTISEIRGAQI